MYAQWNEVFDIDRLTFVDLPEFARLETEDGDSLAIPTDPERLEKDLLAARAAGCESDSASCVGCPPPAHIQNARPLEELGGECFRRCFGDIPSLPMLRSLDPDHLRGTTASSSPIRC